MGRRFLVSVPTTEPTQVRVGDTIQWSKSLSEYLPSDGWTLHYTLINASNKINITTSPDGDSHLVSISATTSASYNSGEYTWSAHVEDGTDRHTISTGIITLLPDLAVVDTYDHRSYCQKALEAIEATLLRKASSDQKAMIMPYGGRRIDRYDVNELINWRDKLRAELFAERRKAENEAGTGKGRKILTEFVRPH